ncbi:hypothetical protein G4B88_027931 [Cannabis sativa]|uniref:Uncharacterized protein n=1 Tax=Cannabis sativa TaxID=3483 RepID=A0A7J6I915_CANSA|nr:hypothetical protein G4B88_027931 [Cannabis sativa]
MHFPPWRKANYMRAKWLSPHSRKDPIAIAVPESESEKVKSDLESQDNDGFSDCGELELIFGEKSLPSEKDPDGAAAEKAFSTDEKISSEPVTAIWFFPTMGRAISGERPRPPPPTEKKVCIPQITLARLFM